MTSKRKHNESGVVRNPFATKKKAPPGPAKKVPEDDIPKAPKSVDEATNDGVSDVIADEPQFNLFVGTEHGILKGIGFGSELPISKTIFMPETIPQKSPGVVSLTWGIEEEDEGELETEKELLVGFTNHVVKTYNTKLRCFTRQMKMDFKPEDPKLIGLCCHNSRNYTFGLEDGTVGMWNVCTSEVALKFKSGDNLCKLKQCPSDRSLYATGGKDCDLKLWNLSSEKPQVPVFEARNVPHDFLDLKVPIWVQDLTFLPRTTEILGVGTRYGHVRLYDIKAGRRPVSSVQAFDHPIMSVSSTVNDRQIIVGTSKGEAALFDLRNPKKEKMCLKYVGFSGSIRCIEASTEKPYFTSCGLDRHLYVHKLNQKAPVKKLYMKQRLNCIALSKTFMATLDKEDIKATIMEKSNQSSDEGMWANIPPEVLDLNKSPIPFGSPTKRQRKMRS